MDYRECYYESDGLRLFYRDYPSTSLRKPVLIIPGMWQNARSFEFIAAHMARTRRVLVADPRGHGRSAYAASLKDYGIAREAGDIVRLLEAARVERVAVLGTSRGGIVAMALANRSFMSAVVLNDIGSEIKLGLFRASDADEYQASHDSWEAATQSLKKTWSSRFLALSDERWRRLVESGHREEAGKIVGDFDPRLGVAARAALSRTNADTTDKLWAWFDQMRRLPTLLLRGEHSRVVPPELVARMKQAKPDLVTITVKDRGHAPLLDEPGAVAAIDVFLAGLH